MKEKQQSCSGGREQSLWRRRKQSGRELLKEKQNKVDEGEGNRVWEVLGTFDKSWGTGMTQPEGGRVVESKDINRDLI